MKKAILTLVLAAGTAGLFSCSKTAPNQNFPGPQGHQDSGSPEWSPRDIAIMLSALPIGQQQLQEVYSAVGSSSGNGYDEEYTMRDLLHSPGSGVGEIPGSKAATYTEPMRDLISNYLKSTLPTRTKAGAADVQAYLDALGDSGMQIYWPYSEDWDGKTLPIVTFDPGFGAESNYGYEISVYPDGYRVVDSVYVDENVAASRPVWVINSNADAGFTPLEMFLSKAPAPEKPSGNGTNLYMKTFTMLRNYDSWFEGGSEFVIQLGSPYGYYATGTLDPTKFNPEITQLMVVVKRKQMGQEIPFDAILSTCFPDELENMAFLVTEDDGGTRTTWKSSATLKVKSKSYGFDIEFPLNTKDDIVWRGQLAASFFRSGDCVKGRFGDVQISFQLE